MNFYYAHFVIKQIMKQLKKKAIPAKQKLLPNTCKYYYIILLLQRRKNTNQFGFHSFSKIILIIL